MSGIPTQSQIKAGNVYQAAIRGWKHGATASRRDPAFSLHSREDIKNAYDRGYADGTRAMAAAVLKYSSDAGYTPSITRACHVERS